MNVHRHAEKALIALGYPGLPVPASVIIDRLKKMEAPIIKHVALVIGHYNPAGTNGDTVVAILREGNVITVMLRWSHQPWTLSALRVEAIETMEGIV
jgi:hypothetical protein